jgi:RNA polymerase sigma-70 factor (ECF subfamily)
MGQLSVTTDTAYACVVVHAATFADDDGALARRILTAAPERDATAESELCRRFAPRIRLYGLRHLRSEAAAADLIQDVLIMTLQKLRAGEVREPERLASFILGTCRQRVIDARRSGDRRERLLDRFSLDLAAFAANDPEPLDSERLQHCLQRLPERERAVLMMTFYDDRPADAVGTELGLSAGNVRVIRHRGIDRLRACMTATEQTS